MEEFFRGGGVKLSMFLCLLYIGIIIYCCLGYFYHWKWPTCLYKITRATSGDIIEFHEVQRAEEEREKRWRDTGSKVSRGAPVTLGVKGLMMMMTERAELVGNISRLTGTYPD